MLLIRNDFFSHLTADCTDSTLQITNTGFSRIVVDYISDCRLGERQLSPANCMLLELLWHQIFLSNVQFLLLDIAGEFDNLHPVEERPWNSLDAICSSDKHRPGQIKGNLQIVVRERFILLRIEHLEQRRRRITPEIISNLIYLIKQK